jgi:hypothetical protein
MTRDQIVKQFEKLVKPGDSENWAAGRAARNLPKGLDPKLMRRVFEKLLSEEFELQTFGGTLIDEYVPLAQEVLAKKKTVDAIFITNHEGARTPAGFRDTVKRLIALSTMTPKKKLANMKAAAKDPQWLSACQTTVAVKGAEAWLQLSVLAHDGSEESADIMLPLVHKALKEKDEELDFLVDLLDDRSLATPTMKPIFAALDGAQDDREKLAKVGDLAERLGGDRKGFKLSMSLQTGQQTAGQGKLSVAFWFFSKRKPEAELFGQRAHRGDWLRFVWEDGKTKENTAKFPPLKDLDGIPAWLAAVAKKYRSPWNWTPLYITTSLRGGARKKLLEWLQGK